MAGDLMVHLISGMLFTWGLNEAPKRAMAMGGILRFKDGRNMPDVHTSLFEYGNVPVYIRLNLGSETPEVAALPRLEGHPRARRERPDLTPQAGDRYRPQLLRLGFPQALREEYVKQWHAEHDPKPGEEPLRDALSYRGLVRRHAALTSGSSSRR